MDRSQTMERTAKNPVSFFSKFIEDMSEVFWVYTGIPFAQGKAQARRDVKDGKMILKTFGPPAKWRGIYSDILQRDYQITLEPVAEGHLPIKERERIRGYNAIIKEEIRKKRGRDFLDMVVERAEEALKQEEQRKGG
jgi:hypothetical protein